MILEGIDDMNEVRGWSSASMRPIRQDRLCFVVNDRQSVSLFSNGLLLQFMNELINERDMLSTHSNKRKALQILGWIHTEPI